MEEHRRHIETINRFLDDLVSHDFIKIQGYPSRNFAAIQPKGIEYLVGNHTSPTVTNISVVAESSQIFSHSSLSSKESTSPTINKISKTNSPSSSKNSWLVKLSMISGIFICLIGIWQLFYPHLLERKVELPLNNISLNKPPNTIRHVNDVDIKNVLDFLPSKDCKLNIYFSSGDTESQSFGQEFRDNLKIDSINLISKFFIGDFITFPSISLLRISDTFYVPTRYYLVSKRKENIVELNIVIANPFNFTPR